MQKHWTWNLNRVAGWAAVALVVAAGCTTEVAQDQNKTAPTEKAASENGSTAQVPAVTAEVVDGAGYRALLERRLGSVVFVDYWATW